MTYLAGRHALLTILHEPWLPDASCADADPEIFFERKGGSPRRAKLICERCPVIGECRDWALSQREVFGVWGGMSEQERRRLLRHEEGRPIGERVPA